MATPHSIRSGSIRVSGAPRTDSQPVRRRGNDLIGGNYEIQR